MANYDAKYPILRDRLLKTQKIVIPLEISGNGGGGGALPNMTGLSNFAAVASSTITNTGGSVLTGDLGLYPGTSVTGFPPGTVSGTQHITDATAAAAQVTAMNAYNDLASRTPNSNLSGQDLGGKTLTAGVYKFNTSAQLTGTVTFSGSSTDVFIIQIGSTLTTASSSVVALSGGASAGNIFWQVGSSATIGTSSTFLGQIFALASITVTTSSSTTGGLYALTGAVTLDTNAASASAPNGGGGNPALKLQLNDEPSRLFLDTQGIDQISLANGSVDNAAELAAITFATPNDVAGQFSLLLRINEPIGKIVSAQLIQINGSETINLTFPTGSTQGITSSGMIMVFNADSAVDLSSFDYKASLVVRYTNKQS